MPYLSFYPVVSVFNTANGGGCILGGSSKHLPYPQALKIQKS